MVSSGFFHTQFSLLCSLGAQLSGIFLKIPFLFVFLFQKLGAMFGCFLGQIYLFYVSCLKFLLFMFAKHYKIGVSANVCVFVVQKEEKANK